jgi:hypothetical protein
MSEEALGAFLMNVKKLYRVMLKPPGNSVEDRWKDGKPWPSMYVASASMENASMKAVQYYNQKNGGDYEVYEISQFASADDEQSVYID